jgi:hypothetical protein
MRGGLVQQEEIRSALGAQKATRERDALTLSSGEVGTVLRDAPARVQAVAGRCCNLGTPPLEGPGSARCSRSTRPCCCGRRNSNVNLDDLRWDRPDIDCEPQQARGIRRNLQVDETDGGVLFGRRLHCSCEGWTRSCIVQVKVAGRCRDWLGVRPRLLIYDRVTSRGATTP